MKKFLTLILTVGIAMMLAACGGDDAEENQQEDEELAEQANEELEVTEEEKVKEDEVVANVNDKDIEGSLYNLIYTELKMQMHQFGQDINNLDEIKDLTLNQLIDQELLKQEAEEQGVEVTDEELQSQFEEFKGESEENFQAYLAEFDLKEEAFKEQIFYSLLLEKYKDEKIKTEEVSDEEAKELYELSKEQNEEIAPYEELEEDIKMSLEDHQKQEKLQEKIEELKQSADIEKLI